MHKMKNFSTCFFVKFQKLVTRQF